MSFLKRMMARKSEMDKEIDRINEEILARGELPLSEPQLTRFGDTFKKFDEDGSGAINLLELGRAMERLGCPRNQLQLRAMLSSVDTDGSGEVEYREFIYLMHNLEQGLYDAEEGEAVLVAAPEAPRDYTEAIEAAGAAAMERIQRLEEALGGYGIELGIDWESFLYAKEAPWCEDPVERVLVRVVDPIIAALAERFRDVDARREFAEKVERLAFVCVASGEQRLDIKCGIKDRALTTVWRADRLHEAEEDWPQLVSDAMSGSGLLGAGMVAGRAGLRGLRDVGRATKRKARKLRKEVRKVKRVDKRLEREEKKLGKIDGVGDLLSYGLKILS